MGERVPAMQKVLVIAPHPDDESIGCGGMIRLHVEGGDPIRLVVLTSGEDGLARESKERAQAIREAEARAAARVLGVHRLDFLRLPDRGLAECIPVAAADLVDILAGDPPHVIYLPHPADAHPDHEAAYPIVKAALAGIRSIGQAELRGYEVWTPMPLHSWVADISAVMDTKLRAILCYRSQLCDVRYDRAAVGLNLYRGAMAAGSSYAEAFCWLPGPEGDA